MFSFNNKAIGGVALCATLGCAFHLYSSRNKQKADSCIDRLVEIFDEMSAAQEKELNAKIQLLTVPLFGARIPLTGQVIMGTLGGVHQEVNKKEGVLEELKRARAAEDPKLSIETILQRHPSISEKVHRLTLLKMFEQRIKDVPIDSVASNDKLVQQYNRDPTVLRLLQAKRENASKAYKAKIMSKILFGMAALFTIHQIGKTAFGKK